MSPAEFSACIVSLYGHALAEWDDAAEITRGSALIAFLIGQLVALKATLIALPEPQPIDLQVLMMAIDACLESVPQELGGIEGASEPGATRH